jgi:hypothetical protein
MAEVGNSATSGPNAENGDNATQLDRRGAHRLHWPALKGFGPLEKDKSMKFRQQYGQCASARYPSIDPGCRGARTAGWFSSRPVGSALAVLLLCAHTSAYLNPPGSLALCQTRLSGSFDAPALRGKGPHMTPRFFYDSPPPTSIGDRLLAEANSIELRLMKNSAGNVAVFYEVKGSIGSDQWLNEEEDDDSADEKAKSVEAMNFASALLGAFAAAGSRGDA